MPVEEVRAELMRVIDLNPKAGTKTRAKQRSAVDRWLAYSQGDWSPMTAQAFYNSLLAEGRLKPQSANNIVINLRSVTNQWAAYLQEPKLAIFEAVQTKDNEQPLQAMVLDEKQAEHLVRQRLFETPLGLRDFAIIILGLQTGMRRMSFAGATLENTSLANRMMRVPVKGGRKFDVPLSNAAAQALEPWMAWLAGHGIKRGPLLWSFHPARIEPREPLRGPLTERGFDEVVGYLRRDAGIQGLTPHSFRHTFVTWCRFRDVPAFMIAAVTGHVLEKSVGGEGGMIGDVYTRREIAGAEAAERIAQPWMFKR
jgi:integrase